MQLRIATFNVHHGQGRDGRIDLARTASVLDALDADLIALQELDRGTPRSGNVDQVAAMQQLIGMTLHFWPTLKPYAGGEYGIALAARARLDTTFVELPRSARGEPRGAVLATLEDVTVVATHLAKADPDRALQTQALAELAAGATTPSVIAGDLNQSRSSLGPLLRAGFTAGPRRATVPPWWLLRQIDFVLAGPGLRITELRTVATEASDHRPLVATVGSR